MEPQPSAFRPRDRRELRAVSAGLAVVVLTIVATLVWPTGGGPAQSAGPSPSGPISWTPAPGSPAPTDGTEAWTRLQLSPVTPLAELTATRVIGRRVATISQFTLHSVGAVSAADLASRIEVEPAVELTITPGATGDSVSLAPATALREGTRYRFRLYAPDGSLAGTWAFRTDAPLHVVGRLPDAEVTDVPTTTGIEVTFDQDEPTGFADHFGIDPAVDGRFEQHDRTWVFVPAEPLAKATIYTVTVKRGVGVTDSDRVLEADVSWQFQTSGATGDEDGPPSFGLPIVEARPGENPVLTVYYWSEDGTTTPSGWPYELYRLPSLGAAAEAVERLLSVPDWACCGPTAESLIDTASLPRVAAGKAALGMLGVEWGTSYVRLPVQPDPGWYVVVLPDEHYPRQAILQVTNLTAFVQTTDTRTLAWLSDVRTLAPVAGAAVAVPGEPVLGTTDNRGVLVAATPPSLVTDDSEPYSWWTKHVLTITPPSGPGLVATLGLDGYGYPPRFGSPSFAKTPEGRWWLVLSTDRRMYRSTDTIHAWGVVRSRGDLRVPSDVELRLETPTEFQGGAPVAIVRVPAGPTARGVFSADLPLAEIPHGAYEVSLYVAGERLTSTWIQVTEIRKPAFRIDLTTDRRVYIAGDPIKVGGALAFYDGTGAPGIAIRAGLEDDGIRVVADDAGRFSATLRAVMGWSTHEGWNDLSVVAAPATPEEGLISGAAQIVVFPASVWLSGDATLSGDRLTVTGTLSRINRAGVEAQLANGEWNLRPAGTPLADRTVSVRIVHVIPVKRQIGTTYDFITKQARPVYSYTSREEVLLTRSVTTGDEGRLRLGLDVPAPNHGYRIELSARDGSGRWIRLERWASERQAEVQPWSYPYLVDQLGCGYPTVQARLGEPAVLSVHEGNGAPGRDGQYLFMVGERGLVDTIWQTSATLQRTFTSADLPNFQVRAVRLTQAGYQVLNPVTVEVDRADKSLAVSLTPDRARYRPGGTLTIAIRTLGPDGQPIVADVVVRAVDEKLFAMGGALDVDVLEELLRNQPSGFLQSFASHQLPYTAGDGCGGGGGGGGRDDFRDSATFQRVTTGVDGRATVSFTAPDDLTSWHVSASAVSRDLDAGSASVLVPVGLPFFADAVVAPEYLAGERPVLVIRAYGDALHAGDDVSFVVRSPDLGLEPVTVAGHAFTPASVRLPMLAPGRHEVTISASAAAGGLSDAVVRTIVVVPSRLGRLEQRQDVVTGTLTPPGGDGLTSYVVSDVGRGSLVPLLASLAADAGARLDQSAAAFVARRLLVEEFGLAAADLPDPGLDMHRYEREGDGVALLPYGSTDLELTALLALTAPELFLDRGDAESALQAWSEGEATTRERRVIALAGRAGLGDDVLEELQSIDRGSLTVREELWLGIGLLAAGDESSARAIERDLLTAYGEAFGPWVRLNAGDRSSRTLEVTGLMLQLAGGLGDSAAAGMSRYLESQPSSERPFSLEQVAYARGALDRLARSEARFAWTVGGERHEVTLEPGGSFALTLTPSQRSTFSVERLAGTVVVNSAWTGPADLARLPDDDGVTITRSTRPLTDAPRDELVRVTIKVTFGAQVPVSLFEVTDLLPSGLAPLSATADWPGDEEEAGRDELMPYAIDGQRVRWLLDSLPRTRSYTLVYSARVVSPGSYTWEPAVVQGVNAPTIGGHTEATTFTIR